MLSPFYVKTIKIKGETHHNAKIEAATMGKDISEFCDEAIEVRISLIRRGRGEDRPTIKKGVKS